MRGASPIGTASRAPLFSLPNLPLRLKNLVYFWESDLVVKPRE